MLYAQTPPVSYLISNGVLNDSPISENYKGGGGDTNARFINQETFPVDIVFFTCL